MAKLAQIDDAAPYRGHIEWSTDLLELRPDPKWWRRRPLSNASKNARFNVVWENYDWNNDDVSAESEGDVAVELGTNCNLGRP
jgi:hypothetical protein